MFKRLVLPMVLAAAASTPAMFGASFVNGNFETGDASGWTIGGGYRGDVLNPDLKIPDFLPGGSRYDSTVAGSHSSIVGMGTDPNTSNQLNQVYSGKYSWRVEDTVNGGYASVISQSVKNYTDSKIFFAWAAVLEGAHGPTDAATIQIVLSDTTVGDNLVAREYNAGTTGTGVDKRFHYDSSTNFYWTPWQIEQIMLPTSRIGDDFTLSILAADCQPTGHTGYAYLDGFGNVLPPPTNAPEPGSMALLGSGLGLALLALRKRRSKN